MTRAWLGVVSHEHVLRGVDLGIAQINHGSRAGLMRMRRGDTLIYYSPTTRRGESDGYRSFTAVGTFPDDETWQADEGAFRPFRRRIDYLDARPLALAAVRERLALTSTPGWGRHLRLGHIELDPLDAALIRAEMTR